MSRVPQNRLVFRCFSPNIPPAEAGPSQLIRPGCVSSAHLGPDGVFCHEPHPLSAALVSPHCL